MDGAVHTVYGLPVLWWVVVGCFFFFALGKRCEIWKSASGKLKELSSIFQAELIKMLLDLKGLFMLAFNTLKANQLLEIFIST